jgi:hypothetical protein
MKQKQKMLFTPSTYFMGSHKNNEAIKILIDFLKQQNANPHFSSESDFLGDTSYALKTAIDSNKMNLIGGEYIGIKTNKRKPVLIEDLMEDNYLDLNANIYGIYIPEEEILLRPKYEWFAVLNSQQILETNIFIAKHIKASMVDAFSDYSKSTEIRSIIAI